MYTYRSFISRKKRNKTYLFVYPLDEATLLIFIGSLINFDFCESQSVRGKFDFLLQIYQFIYYWHFFLDTYIHIYNVHIYIVFVNCSGNFGKNSYTHKSVFVYIYTHVCMYIEMGCYFLVLRDDSAIAFYDFIQSNP